METISQTESTTVTIEELLQGLTETFTQQERQQLLTKVFAASEAAKTELLKYFSEIGEYLPKKFLKDLQFFNPIKSLSYPKNPNLIFPNFDAVSAVELKMYRQEARSFEFPVETGEIVEDLRKKIQAVYDFWRGKKHAFSAIKYCHGLCIHHTFFGSCGKGVFVLQQTSTR